MKTYFLSSQPCALTINDVFFGVTDLFERFANVHLTDNLCIRFTPQNAQPICFFLNDNIRFQAPNGVEVYFVKDGVALYAKHFPPTDYTLHPITQGQFDNTLVTVFQQGEVQIAFQSPHRFQTDVLPSVFLQCQLQREGDILLLSCPTHLAVYTLTGTRLFLEEVSYFSVEEDRLEVTLPLSEMLGRSAKCIYQILGDTLSRTSFSLTQARTRTGAVDQEAIQNELFPFAFFETVRIGGDFTYFLAEDLLPKADNLRAFLGEFVAVIPTGENEVFGLVKRIGERIFETTYYRVHIQNGKICDVTG